MENLMKIRIQAVLFLYMLTHPVLLFAAPPEEFPTERPSKEILLSTYGKLPLSFEENRGQVDPRVAFLSRGKGYTLYLTATEAVLALQKESDPGAPQTKKSIDQAVLKMQLVHANPKAAVSGEELLPGKNHYFVGKDPKQWKTGIPTYGKVKYERIYPGIDLIYYGNQHQLEYDFVVAPGADPKKIGLRFDGAEKAHLSFEGDLILNAGEDEVRFHRPLVYQEGKSGREIIPTTYVKKGRGQIGFQVAAYDRTRPLIIDPVLSYATYFGGTSDDAGNGIAVDASGNAYLTGKTTSSNFPTTPGALDTASHFGDIDAFVAKLNAAGTGLIYATYLGGSQKDYANGIAIDSSGNAYVTGYTLSSDFPTTSGSYQPTGGFHFSGFVAKLNASGSALIYSTYLPVTSAEAIAIDPSGNAYITGAINEDFPLFVATPGAFQVNQAGVRDAFIIKLNPAGSAAIYASYLGGRSDDWANSLAVDEAGNAYVAGSTLSGDFPLIHPIQGKIGGGEDAFVAKISPAGDHLVYSTYVGGSGEDEAHGIAVDTVGNAYLTGSTTSVDFPVTPGVFQPVIGKQDDPNVSDAFVSKINPQGNGLVYSSYLGGNYYDFGKAIAVDKSGNAYVTGSTASSDFPLVRSLKSSILINDIFVSRVSPTGSSLTFSTYLGGSSFDFAGAIALDPLRNIYLIGEGGDFPITPGAFQKSVRNMIVAKISDSKVVAQITADVAGGAGPLTVHFAGTALSESGAAITSYQWDFGDGTTGSGSQISHTYQTGGYTALLTVMDAKGERGSAHANVSVGDFGLSANSDLATIVPGAAATSKIHLGGNHVPIEVSCATPPVTGLACSMNPKSGVPRNSEDRHDPGTLSILTVTTQPSTPVGSYPITVTGRLGNTVHQLTLILVVEPGDNFNRPNGSALDRNWNEILPNLEIFDGQIRNTDAGSKAAIFDWPIGPDQDVSVHCKVTTSGNGCGVMARWSNTGNYYYARIDVGHHNLVLFKSVNGIITELGRKDIPTMPTDFAGAIQFDTYYSLRLITKGSAISATVIIPSTSNLCSDPPCLSLNPYEVTVTDASLSAGDYAGIRSFASGFATTWFEDFSVTRPDGDLPGRVLFNDEFNRTGGLGGNWKVYAGSFSTDGTFAVSGSSGNWAAITPGLGTDDYTVESVLTVPSGALFSGIVARSNPSTGFTADLYSAQIASDGNVNLYRRNKSVWTLLKRMPAGIVARKPYTLSLKVSGNNPVYLEVSLNQKVLFGFVDQSASKLISGIPGIENYDRGIKYDRFTVYLNSPSTVNEDSFNRSDSPDLGPNWIESLPSLEIYAGAVRNVDAGSKAAVWKQAIGPDQDVAVDCSIGATGNMCAVMARWANATNFYHARLDVGAGDIVLFKTVNGISTVLGRASRPLQFGTYGRLRLVAKGSSLSVFFQDEPTPMIQVTDTSISGTFAGIRSYASAPEMTWFDNFRVLSGTAIQ
jgi:hypothetical protein